ncbi:FAD-dependent oxidoreductase [Candidatus Woesearchaeota archaeon]|nr:FAD-dependent oxidoreductase [Candidatus Woesearchaeota archaeon]
MAKYDIVIIGGGVSGMGAALYSGRFMLKTAVVTTMPGGAIINTNDIANYPGIKNITGFELFNRISEHALEYGVEVINSTVTRIKKEKDYFLIYMDEEVLESKAVIIATGTVWKKLGIPGEEEFKSKGVHYCALCDGAFYKGKTVVVVGGSDTAAKDALLLTEYADKVYIIYRREKIRAEPITLSRVEENSKIEIINNTNVKEIQGQTTVQKVLLDKPYNGSTEFETQGVFIAIGHIPISNLAKDLGVKLNQKDEIVIDRRAMTNISGVFAAGDVCDGDFKQAITGVAEGVTAAYSAYNFVGKVNLSGLNGSSL